MIKTNLHTFSLLVIATGLLLVGACKKSTTVPTPSLPSVTTAALINVTDSSATCGGTVTADGGAAVTARGVCWGTLNFPTVPTNVNSDGTGLGTYTSSVTGLKPKILYYLRAYATNSAGTAYGEEVLFSTPQ